MAFKAVVKVYHGKPEKIVSSSNYRSPVKEETLPQTAEQITGEVFAITVTGQTIEEVTRKAKAMLDANVEVDDPIVIDRTPR